MPFNPPQGRVGGRSPYEARRGVVEESQLSREFGDEPLEMVGRSEG